MGSINPTRRRIRIDRAIVCTSFKNRMCRDY